MISQAKHIREFHVQYIIGQIHQVLVKIVRTYNLTKTYVEKDNPWLGVLAASEFANLSTTNRGKGYSPGQLIFGHDIIIPINKRGIRN